MKSDSPEQLAQDNLDREIFERIVCKDQYMTARKGHGYLFRDTDQAWNAFRLGCLYGRGKPASGEFERGVQEGYRRCRASTSSPN